MAAAPSGAAGFSFGSSIEETQKLCEEANLHWSPSGKEWACSAAPTPVGFEAAVNIRACSGRVCSISLVHRPATGWMAFIGDVKDRLVAKYGEPTESDDLLPRMCRSSQDFEQCVDSGKLHLRFAWSWPSGERVALVVGQVNGERGTVRIDYGKVRSEL